ncbi:MAG TPA: hypothetical protein VKE69_05575, partial [Planctomycetota bacterium]|nr:hypothetical protein [Planctomycetota bacterium]
VWLVSQVRPIYHPRYLLATLPALVVLAARARPPALAATLAAAPILVGAAIEPLLHRFVEKPDYRGAAVAFVARCEAPDPVRCALIDDKPFGYYVHLQAPPGSPAVDAVESHLVREMETGRRFVLDAMAPWHRLYSLDAETVFEHRASPAPPAPDAELLFESSPVPSLRLWRVK